MATLEQMRSKALDEIDRARRNFRFAFFAATFFECLFLVAIFLVADLRDRLHLLIIFATGLIYMPLVIGLVALGAWVDRSVLRVLARIDEVAARGARLPSSESTEQATDHVTSSADEEVDSRIESREQAARESMGEAAAKSRTILLSIAAALFFLAFVLAFFAARQPAASRPAKAVVLKEEMILLDPSGHPDGRIPRGTVLYVQSDPHADKNTRLIMHVMTDVNDEAPLQPVQTDKTSVYSLRSHAWAASATQ